MPFATSICSLEASMRQLVTINSAKQTLLFQIRHRYSKAAPNGNGTHSKIPLNACEQSGMPVAIFCGKWRGN